MGAGNTKAELRRFGVGLAVISGVGFGVLFPWSFGLSWSLWPWIIGCIILGLALMAPQVLRPVNNGLIRIAHPIGRFNSVLLLSVVFYLLVCPMGFLMRAFKRDPIKRGFDPSAESYRKKSGEPTSLEVPF